jgi:Holliday junction resolvase RusA-like endonuclease
VRFTFPYELVVPVNARQTVRRGSNRIISTTRYRDRKNAMRLLAQTQYKGNPIEGPVRASVQVWFPDRRRRDIQNILKQPLDAIEGVAYTDDCNIHLLSVLRAGVSKGNPRIEVNVTPMEEE